MRCHKAGYHYFAPTNQFLVDFIARYLAIFNSSINFVIYCLVGSQFRNVLLQMLGLKVLKVPEERSKSRKPENQIILHGYTITVPPASSMSYKLQQSTIRTTLDCEKSQSLLVTLTQSCTRAVSPMSQVSGSSQLTLTVEDSPMSTSRMFNLTVSTSSSSSSAFTHTFDTKV